MLVRGARIHRFRGLNELDIPIGPVTIIIGRNGAGKSSVLEALGHVTSEAGAFGRIADEPADVSWYFGFSERSAALEALESALGPDEHALLGTLAEHLLIRFRPQLPQPKQGDSARLEARFAFDRFHGFVDRSDSDQYAMLAELRRATAHLSISSPLAGLAERVESPGSPHAAFVDLDVEADAAQIAPPSIISMFATPDDISPMMYRQLTKIGSRYFAGVHTNVDAALDALADGHLLPLDEAGLLQPILRTWTQLVNEIAPPFLRNQARIELTLNEGPDHDLGLVWRTLQQLLHDQNRSVDDLPDDVKRLLEQRSDAVDAHLEAIYIEAGGDPTDGFRFSRLGTGHRRWICATVDEAARILTATAPESATAEAIQLAIDSQLLPQGTTMANRTCIRLIDEPVDSLESRIHGEVVEWLQSRGQSKEHLVMSTHRPSLLPDEHRAGDLVVVGLRRHPGGQTSNMLFGPSLMEEFRASLGELGIKASELLFLARGLLLVEGSDDIDVLMTLYGDELNMRGIFVHNLGGNTKRAIISAFSHTAYRMLDIPTWVMLDKMVDDQLTAGLTFVSDESASTTVREANEELPNLRSLPFNAPDIGFGIRPSLYHQVHGGRFPADDQTGYRAWTTPIHHEGNPPRPISKDWLTRLASTGPRHTPNFSKDVLTPVLTEIRTMSDRAAAASPWLASTMSRLFREFDALYGRDSEGQTELG